MVEQLIELIPFRESSMSKSTSQRYPVSADCPQCESTEFKKVRATSQTAIQCDRVCKKCGTRYTPPTPEWAKPVLGFIGLGALAAGIGFAIFAVMQDPPMIKATVAGIFGGVVLCGMCMKVAFFTK